METVTLQASSELINDKRKDGWELLEDVSLEGNSELEAVNFLKGGEEYIYGETMLSRAKELGGLCGQRHAERLLSMASNIPESWRGFYLVFPGTVWRDSDNDHLVQCLIWRGGRWCPTWGGLGSRGWGRYGNIVRLCPA